MRLILSRPMNWKAKSYISAVITAGVVLLALQLILLAPQNSTRFWIFTSVTVLASGLKVRLPGVTGTMSVNFLLVLIAIPQLSLPELLMAGLGATILQSYWNAKKRPRPVQLGFNVAASSLAVAAANYAFSLPLIAGSEFGMIGRLAVSSVVLFAANTVPVAFVIALTENKSPKRVWQDCYFWCFPYYLMGATIAGIMSYLSAYLGWFTALSVLPVIHVIYTSYRLYLGKLEDEKQHAEQVASLHFRTIEALALAIEAKDHTTHEHLRRVQTYALEIAKELSLSKDQTDALQAASLLHDIGKLAVPEHIISKPGRLTPEEFEKMKIHPIVGAEILERVQFPYPVAPVVRCHHEKWDGSGYPDGLSGEQIPIGARILSAVDCLDALASDRQYRRALPLDDAMKVVISESGKAFEPRIVEILARRYREFEELARSGVKVPDRGKLSTDVKVARGAAPDAGFEAGSSPSPATQAPARASGDFLESIAKARQEALDLFELSQALGSSLRLSDTLSMLAMRIRQLVAYDSLVVYLIRGKVLKAEYVLGEDSRLFSSLEIPRGEGLSGWVADNNKPIVNGNPSVEPGYLNDPKAFSKLNSALAVPLAGSEQVIGVLALYHRNRDAFSRDQLRVLQVINSKVAIAIENALKFEQAETSATTDYVTSLPNARSLFVHLDGELSRSERSGAAIGVLVCDVDGFKKVNDRFGHNVGNQVLSALAGELRAQCRPYDHIARAGGDEFVMVMPGMSRDIAAERMRTLDEASRRVCLSICGEEVISLSCGDAYFPEDGRTAEELMDVADRRMYRQKQQRKLEQAQAEVPAVS